MKASSAVFVVVSALVSVVGCSQLAGFRDIDIVDAPDSAPEASASGDGGIDGESTPDSSTTDGSAPDGSDASTCDAGVVPVAANCGDAGGAGSGRILVHAFVDVSSTPDHQGIMAVAGGVPNTAMGPNLAVWNAEKLKSWYTVDNYISSVAGVETVVSTCVPPGSYSLQYWDIWGAGGGTNNGTPPTVTYVWQIGNSSELVMVAPGATTEVTLTVAHASTTSNVPTTGSFYGTWASWDYGACNACGCPSNATCSLNKCLDYGYDVRNCGTAGAGCAGKTCCKNGCVDTASDAKHCGGCGNACMAGHACMAGQCQ